MPFKSIVTVMVVALTAAHSYTDYGPSRSCPLASGSLVVVTDTEQRVNNYLIGEEGRIIAHGKKPKGYYVQIGRSVKLFKCADIEAINPKPAKKCLTNNDCPAGHSCQHLLGNTNGATTCVKNAPAPYPDYATCWMGPSCMFSVGGQLTTDATMREQKAQNCFIEKSKCFSNNPSKKPSGCFANKGGMCVYLQQNPSYNNNDSCFATQTECLSSLSIGSVLGSSHRSLRGLKPAAATSTTAPTNTPSTNRRMAGTPPL